MPKITGKQVLDVVIKNSDAGNNITIRQYLKQLLKTLWDEGEGFSGKRPFGNSSWEFELYKPLIVAGFVKGSIDEEWGDIIDFDKSTADMLIFKAIKEL